MVCHNPDQAGRDREVRANLVTQLEHLIAGSDTWTPRRRDELVGSLKSKPGLRRTYAAPAVVCYAWMSRRSHARRTWTATEPPWV